MPAADRSLKVLSPESEKLPNLRLTPLSNRVSLVLGNC